MLDKIKIALRITHSYLDSEIEDCIASAKAEMLRAGISQSAIDNQDNLIEMAIKTYCLAHYSNNEKMAEGYENSFQYQLENLRKSSDYNV